MYEELEYIPYAKDLSGDLIFNLMAKVKSSSTWEIVRKLLFHRKMVTNETRKEIKVKPNGWIVGIYLLQI